MSSGARVVIAMFGGVAALTVLIVGAFFLTDTGNLRCVEGELQDNARDASGNFVPRVESFATVAEAEAFICRKLPRPRRTSGLALAGVSTTRSHNLGSVIEGTGGAVTEFSYVGDEPASFLDLTVGFPESRPETSGEETLRLLGVEAELTRAQDGGAILTWDKGGMSFRARAGFGAGFDFEDMLVMLESIR